MLADWCCHLPTATESFSSAGPPHPAGVGLRADRGRPRSPWGTPLLRDVAALRRPDPLLCRQRRRRQQVGCSGDGDVEDDAPIVCRLVMSGAPVMLVRRRCNAAGWIDAWK